MRPSPARARVTVRAVHAQRQALDQPSRGPPAERDGRLHTPGAHSPRTALHTRLREAFAWKDMNTSPVGAPDLVGLERQVLRRQLNRLDDLDICTAPWGAAFAARFIRWGYKEGRPKESPRGTICRVDAKVTDVYLPPSYTGSDIQPADR